MQSFNFTFPRKLTITPRALIFFVTVKVEIYLEKRGKEKENTGTKFNSIGICGLYISGWNGASHSRHFCLQRVEAGGRGEGARLPGAAAEWRMCPREPARLKLAWWWCVHVFYAAATAVSARVRLAGLGGELWLCGCLQARPSAGKISSALPPQCAGGQGRWRGSCLGEREARLLVSAMRSAGRNLEGEPRPGERILSKVQLIWSRVSVAVY